MSPARLIEQTEQDLQLQTLARALDALLATAQQLSLKEQDLQRRVKYAYDEYAKLANRVDGGFTAEEDLISQKILRSDSETSAKVLYPVKPQDIVNGLRDSGHIQNQMLDVITAGVKCSATVVGLRTSNDLDARSNPCLVAANARRGATYERDFTTNGVRGSLRCPFAKTADNSGSANGIQDAGNYVTNTCEYDPIKADLSQDRVSSAGFSVRSSAARCPIRYMDLHSPEEVAQYFENHKHEIPRSHAICVKRYQKDGETMRQIDAKYGNLVNMIQGLGQRHKAFLPSQEQNGAPATTSTSAERVEKWAEDVSSRSPRPGTLTTVDKGTPEEPEPSDRTGRFERPLREIRVGESPSRPWGIPVPISHRPPITAANSPVAPVHVLVPNGTPEVKKQTESDMPLDVPPQDVSPTPARPAGRCPFNHKAPLQSVETSSKSPGLPNQEQKPGNADDGFKDQNSGDPTLSPEAAKPSEHSPAKMIFNGPVFFGYSAEQAATLMEKLASRGVVS